MKITQAILPVAGLGTRFLPWTKTVPKELLPIGNEPIIAHLVNECLDIGIDQICFVINRGKESIPQYFYQDPALEAELEKRGKLHHLEELKQYDSVDFHVVYQDQQLGDGHAILQAQNWIDDEPTAVLFGDDLFAGHMPGISQLASAYATMGEEGAVLALENIPAEHTEKYGIVEVEHDHPQNPRLKKVKSLVEKPHPDEAPSTLGIVGRYIIPRQVVDTLKEIEGDHSSEIRLIDALIQSLGSIDVYGYECEGTRLDTGTPEGYAHAVQVWRGLESK